MSESAQILIVDDEPNVRLVFRTALESAGYHVAEAGDGAVALKLVQQHHFDVVLLDLRMPQLDGMETLRRFREHGIDVPTVIVTAHGSIPDVVEALGLGAVDFIPKPLAPETLRRTVRQAVLARREVASRTPANESLGQETLSRAREALHQGEVDEADFFLRVAAPLGVDPGAIRQLSAEITDVRKRQGHGAYRVAGGLTWG
jgi:DNA-binding NtrC family response regulator